MKLTVLSVNVAMPRVIATRAEGEVLSAIGKKPIAAGSVLIAKTNVAGDAQADLTVHGGPDKAVYAYSADHWPWWRDSHGMIFGPGGFGENLTLAGAVESDIAIGDRFRWGSALLEVSQPRAPCYKFQIHSGREDAAALMTISGRCGWYLRVVEPGEGRTDAALERVARGGGVSVVEAFRGVFDRRISREERDRLAADPALANDWRVMLRRGQ